MLIDQVDRVDGRSAEMKAFNLLIWNLTDRGFGGMLAVIVNDTD